jgi:hypothetical protein
LDEKNILQNSPPQKHSDYALAWQVENLNSEKKLTTVINVHQRNLSSCEQQKEVTVKFGRRVGIFYFILLSEIITYRGVLNFSFFLKKK